MMVDQTVVSLRPGGGFQRKRIVFGSSHVPVLRPHVPVTTFKELYEDLNITQGLRDIDMTNAKQGGEQQNASHKSGFEQEEDDGHVTLTTVHDRTEDVNEIASLMNILTVPSPPPPVNPSSHLTTIPQQQTPDSTTTITNPTMTVTPLFVKKTKSPSANKNFLPQKVQNGAGPAAPITPVHAPSFGNLTVLTPKPKMKTTDELKKKSDSLLEEYFSVRMLDEALHCVKELNSPEYHSELVKIAISLALDKNPPCVEPISILLNYLFSKKLVKEADLGTGCISYGLLLDDIAIDLPKAPNNFGEIMGHLLVSGCIDRKVVDEVLQKIEDDYYQKAVSGGVTKIVG
nr:eukaryotic translation initiation factor-like [Tanacetum cinerariifolium]